MIMMTLITDDDMIIDALLQQTHVPYLHVKKLLGNNRDRTITCLDRLLASRLIERTHYAGGSYFTLTGKKP